MAIAACYAGLLAPAPAVAYAAPAVAAYAAPAPAVAYAAPAAYAAPVAYAAAPAAVREDTVVAGPSGTIASSRYGAGAVYYG